MWSERWVDNLQARCQRDPGAPGTGTWQEQNHLPVLARQPSRRGASARTLMLAREPQDGTLPPCSVTLSLFQQLLNRQAACHEKGSRKPVAFKNGWSDYGHPLGHSRRESCSCLLKGAEAPPSLDI